jgi:hypothetical protein
MKSIYKYKMEVREKQILRLPKNAHILDVQTQYGVPVLWAVVEPEAPLVDYKILCVGTGDSIVASDYWYLGTVQMGTYVWHFFKE